MYVCVCRAVTERDIRKAIDEGAQSVRDLREKLKVTESCGSCLETVKQCLNEAKSSQAA
ncbi:MAG: bacterioferritin-associated ferredoxin [Gammaproteobacteria bacterium]|jgi:bacterioferritin-associated ferredoxin